MKRLFSIVAAASILVCGAPSAKAQDGLNPEEIQAIQSIDRINNVMEDLLSSMESYRVRGECDKFRSEARFMALALNWLEAGIPTPAATDFRNRFAEASSRPCEPRAPVESVAGDLAPTLGEVGPQDPEYAIRQLRAIYEECVNGDVPEEAVPLYQERYDRFQAEIRAARDAFRRAAIGEEASIREHLLARMRVYEAGLEGMPEGFLCRSATAEDDDGTSVASAEDDGSTGERDTPSATRPDQRTAASFDTPADGAEAIGGDIGWLLGVWRAPQGGAIGFRQETDGTASAYVAELNDRMRENGYASGQVFLRGCRDRTSDSLAVWVHSARCEESFRERWEGASMVIIPVGDETLDVGSYYGDPLVGLEPLSRSGR